jgi:PmbA protein
MTDLVDPQALLSQAEDVVLRLMGLGADCAEVFIASSTSVSVEVEKDVVTYTTSDSEAGIGLRVVRDGRLGFAYTSQASKVEEAGVNALGLTRLAPLTGYSLPAGGGPYTTVPGLSDPALMAMEPAEAVEMGGQLVEAAREVHPEASVAGGGVGFGHGAAAVANSEGVSVASHGTSISVSAYVVLRDTSVSTGFEWVSSRKRDVDARKVGEEAARMALGAQGATPLEEGGEMTIIFRPTALSELLEYTLVPSVIGDAAQRGESAFTGREGERVAAADITVVDDPTIPGGLSSGRFDDEGVPSRANVLIDEGVLQGFLYDTFTANIYGVQTTASAVRGGGSTWKSQPEAGVTNVVVRVPTRGELDDLIGQVDRGLVVHDVMGAHTANRSTLDFSVNTTMPFEVRNGEVLGVRRPVMLGGNVGDLLRGVTGGGGPTRQCPGGTNLVLPWIAAEGVTVTP